MTAPQSEPSPPGHEKAAPRQGDGAFPSNSGGTMSETGREVKDWCFKVPSSLQRDNTLTIQARFFWGLIRSFEGANRPAYPSLETLVKITGVCRDTIQKYLNELEKAKRLIRFRQRKENGKFLSSRYRTLGGPQRKISATDKPSPQRKSSATKNSATSVSLIEKQRAAKKSPDSTPLGAASSVNFPPSQGEHSNPTKPRRFGDGL